MTSDFLPIKRMWERAHRARDDSDSSYFFDLLYVGELALKTLVLELLSGLDDDRERNRYSLEYRLVRADSLGEWAEVLDDALQGPSSQHFSMAGRESQRALNSTFAATDSGWQRQAIDQLIAACKIVDPQFEDVARGKVSFRVWSRTFVWLRNRTRGHGAPTSKVLAQMSPLLESSLELILDGAPAFGRAWAHVKRNLSGKYRVSEFGRPSGDFARSLRGSELSMAEGTYIFNGELRRVPLLTTDTELRDFFVPNGSFKNGRFEVQSYVTDERDTAEGIEWELPVESLGLSETAARSELELVGQSFSNVPPRRTGYVARPILESSLDALLRDDRHPVVTLQGRGGVGKTSLALEVLNNIAKDTDFFAIVWFSARDIDLLPEGPRVVRADVLSRDDVAKDFATLMGTNASKEAAVAYFNDCLSGAGENGTFLFVFDNFETIRAQSELYAAVSNAVRLPNKVLITTRTRDFKADFPIEVRGMERDEYHKLVKETTYRLGIEQIVNSEYEEKLFEESDGHPYITKVLLGEVAHAGKRIAVERIVATKDSMLDALFDRSFASLAPAAQRVFLTLCSWRSLVPRIGLQAALMRPGNEAMDFDRALADLVQASLVEEVRPDDADSEFLSVPLAASVFGKRKLVTSPLKTAIEADLELVRSFGAISTADVARGLAPRLERMTHELAKRATDERFVEQGLSVLQFVASEYPRAWLNVAELQKELGSSSKALESVERYVESTPGDRRGWSMLIDLHRESNDPLSEMHARLQLAELPHSTFYELSSAASRLNGLLASNGIALDKTERRMMVNRIRHLIEGRADEADATDLSRLAWLCLYLQDKDSAKMWVAKGIALESSNTHCISLQTRLGEGSD